MKENYDNQDQSDADIKNLFQGLLGRPPDTEEIALLQNKGFMLSQIEEIIKSSDEYKEKDSKKE